MPAALLNAAFNEVIMACRLKTRLIQTFVQVIVYAYDTAVITRSKETLEEANGRNSNKARKRD